MRNGRPGVKVILPNILILSNAFLLLPFLWQKAVYLWYFSTDFLNQISNISNISKMSNMSNFLYEISLSIKVLISHILWKILGIDDPEIWIYPYRDEEGRRIDTTVYIQWSTGQGKSLFSEVQVKIGSKLVTLALYDLAE